MNVKGKVKTIGAEQVISDKFKKRTISIETEGEYPQVVEFQAANDKCDLLNDLETGAEITIHFNLRGREWTNPQGETKVFNTLDLWKVEKHEGAPKVETEKEPDLPF
jgi:hypothetical protein